MRSGILFISLLSESGRGAGFVLGNCSLQEPHGAVQFLETREIVHGRLERSRVLLRAPARGGDGSAGPGVIPAPGGWGRAHRRGQRRAGAPVTQPMREGRTEMSADRVENPWTRKVNRRHHLRGSAQAVTPLQLPDLPSQPGSCKCCSWKVPGCFTSRGHEFSLGSRGGLTYLSAFAPPRPRRRTPRGWICTAPEGRRSARKCCFLGADRGPGRELQAQG